MADLSIIVKKSEEIDKLFDYDSLEKVSSINIAYSGVNEDRFKD